MYIKAQPGILKSTRSGFYIMKLISNNKINSIDAKCDETMFKMKTNCEQNMTETIHIILP